MKPEAKKEWEGGARHRSDRHRLATRVCVAGDEGNSNPVDGISNHIVGGAGAAYTLPGSSLCGQQMGDDCTEENWKKKWEGDMGDKASGWEMTESIARL